MSVLTPRGYRTDVSLTAQDLCARMFGSVVSFGYRMPGSGVYVHVIGELRQISASGMRVSILVAAHDQDNGGALEEFEIDGDVSVHFLEAL